MLPGVTVLLPASLLALLAAFQPCFTAPSFRTFCALAAGFLAQPGRRTVCGMLPGAGLSRLWSHHRAHRFFSHARWGAGGLGLGAGKRGRPRVKGDRLPSLAVLRRTAVFVLVTLHCYGAHRDRARRGDHLPAVRDCDRRRQAALRRGQARNRLPAEVHRTLPFTLACQALAVIWYATAGHHPADAAGHRARARAPWYRTKAEPSTADMPAKLRRVLIAANAPQTVVRRAPQGPHYYPGFAIGTTVAAPGMFSPYPACAANVIVFILAEWLAEHEPEEKAPVISRYTLTQRRQEVAFTSITR